MNSYFSTRKREGTTGNAISRLPASVRCRGFTLVELLVVISIISVLIALLLPALARARSLANQMLCASNQRQIGVAMYEWADDNKGFAPGCGQGFGMGAGQMVPVAGVNNVTYALPNLNSQYAYQLPAGNAQRLVLPEGALLAKGYITSPTVYVCPSMERIVAGLAAQYFPSVRFIYTYEYHFNIMFTGINNQQYRAWQTGTAPLPFPETQASYVGNLQPNWPRGAPSRLTSPYGGESASACMFMEDGALPEYDYCNISGIPGNLNPTLIGMHGWAIHDGGGTINVLFADGHVSGETKNLIPLPSVAGYPNHVAYPAYLDIPG